MIGDLVLRKLPVDALAATKKVAGAQLFGTTFTFRAVGAGILRPATHRREE
jgi:hypothetical protein